MHFDCMMLHKRGQVNVWLPDGRSKCVMEPSFNKPYPQFALPCPPLPLSLPTTLPFSLPVSHFLPCVCSLSHSSSNFTFSTLHLCSVERYTDPSNKTLNISKVNMKHAMSKKMDRFITAMTQFAGLRMKVSRCTTGAWLPGLIGNVCNVICM